MMHGGYGYGMGPGMMHGGWGYDEETKKFLDETKELRRKIHMKMFDYMEAARDPETAREELKKLRKELRELKKELWDLKKELWKKAREE
jgi:polyhydroxyalkanoate synthesis regulator phasin